MKTLCDLLSPYLFYTPPLMDVLCISGYEVVQFFRDNHADEERHGKILSHTGSHSVHRNSNAS